MPDEERTRVDHLVEAKPKGLGIIMTPLMGFMIRRTLNKAIEALEQRLETAGNSRLAKHFS